MAKASTNAARERIKPEFPDLIKYTNDVVFGQIWERPGLSKRDRSLITVAALVATYRPTQLKAHIRRALSNGVTKAEITEIITHLAFYAGWPAAMTGAHTAMDVYENPEE